jgi:hypothetical protein
MLRCNLSTTSAGVAMQPGVEEKEVGQNSMGKKDTGEGK